MPECGGQGGWMARVLLLTLVPLIKSQFTECDFESGFCGMWQDNTDNQNWTLQTGKTPTENTGPHNATSGRSYAFLESSDPLRANDKARLGTPELNFIGEICLEFSYNMYGQDMGRLAVYRITGQDSTMRGNAILDESGDKGQQWKTFRRTVSLNSNNNRIIWEATKGPDYRSDIAIDAIKINRRSCESSGSGGEKSLPFTCGFESSDVCGFSKGNNGNLWTRQQGRTDSDQTGPSRAYAGTYYMYYEASQAREGDYAVLETPTLNYNGQVCVTFAYHMYGADMGSLRVYASRRGVGEFKWQRSGDQGNQWKTSEVTLDLRNDKVAFRSTRGRDIKSDACVDDIRVRAGSCSSVTPATTTTTTTRRPSQTNLPFNCDFERDFCGMRQSPVTDQFDWLRISGATATQNTGPNSAQQGSNYMYAEASSPRTENDKTIIETPIFGQRGDVCVEFLYHMYGADMGRLRVYSSFSGPQSSFFEESGDKQERWITSRRITTFIQSGETIRFEAIIGRGIRSDIAVDNIRITQGSCSGGTPNTTPGPAPPAITDLFRCDMEGDGSGNNQCRLRQDRSDNMDWVWRTARTPTSVDQNRRWRNDLYPVTGPERAQQGTYYLYIEASGKRKGDLARLIIEGDDARRGGDNCLRFWVNMNGHHVGALRVFVRRSGNRRYVWNFYGDQGPNWFRAAVDINRNNVDEVGVEGEVNGEFSGDIAIDELSINSGRCQQPPSGYMWGCSFEMNDGAATMCNMEQDTTDSPNYDWILWHDKTPSDDTGPNQAYNGRFFIYMEASSPWTTGNRARIYLPRLNRSGQVCVEFYYNMYGHHMGKLEVITRVGSSSNPQSRWSIENDQRNEWKQHRLNIENLRSDETIGFQGTRGTAFSSDMALDNIRVRSGRC